MRKAFISYRHNTHKHIKDKLIELNDKYDLFIDKSVDSGDISDKLHDETIRQKIRDEKLKDSTITLFIHGEGTAKRKFIDWELAGSMIDYKESKRNAIIIINLDDFAFSSRNTNVEDVSIDLSDVKTLTDGELKSEDFWKKQLPNAPKRVIKNMTRSDVYINVIRWSDLLLKPIMLRNLIEKVYKNRLENKYDVSIELKKDNN